MKSHKHLYLVSASTLGSLLAAIGCVINLEPEDRITVDRGVCLTALGFVFFLSLFELLSSLILETERGTRLRLHYRITPGEVLDINNKLVSAVQAVFSCVTGAMVCAYSCTRDFLRTSHYMSEAYAWFGTAYFFYDIWSMYKVHVYMSSEKETSKRTKLIKNGDSAMSAGDAMPKIHRSVSFWAYCRHEPVILFHHLFIGGFGFMVIVYLRGELGDCVYGFVYLMELSTPLVSARGVLSRLRLKASRLYLLNGLAMLLLFALCRVCCLPYVLYLYSRVTGLSYLEALSTLPWGCVVSMCILLVPQLYWFWLMSRGALRVLAPKRSPSAPSGDAHRKTR